MSEDKELISIWVTCKNIIHFQWFRSNIEVIQAKMFGVGSANEECIIKGAFMKKFLNLVSVASLSTLILSGCPGNSGGANPTPNGMVGQMGQIVTGSYSPIQGESCNITISNYTCSQIINGVTVVTQPVLHSTLQQLCSNLNNYQLNTGSSQMGQVQVAQQTRSQYYSTYCQNISQTYPGYPGGTGSTTMQGFKSFSCQLQVKKGTAVYPGPAQQFYLPETGGTNSLFASTLVNKRIARFFQITRMAQLARVNMVYSPALSANSQSLDTITMSVENIDGETSASTTGFAGAENRIEITPSSIYGDSDKTQLIATCVSTDARIQPILPNTGKYRCAGYEIVNGRRTPIDYTNQLSDVMSSGISLSRSAYLAGDSAVQVGQGLVSLTQSGESFDESTVQLKSAIMTPMRMTVDKLGYSLRVSCQPK